MTSQQKSREKLIQDRWWSFAGGGCLFRYSEFAVTKLTATFFLQIALFHYLCRPGRTRPPSIQDRCPASDNSIPSEVVDFVIPRTSRLSSRAALSLKLRCPPRVATFSGCYQDVTVTVGRIIQRFGDLSHSPHATITPFVKSISLKTGLVFIS